MFVRRFLTIRVVASVHLVVLVVWQQFKVIRLSSEMKILMKRPRLTLILMFLAGATAYAQNEAQPRKHEQPDAVQLENVHIQAQSVASFFSELSLSHNVPIGLEIATNDSEFMVYDMELKKGTVAELLNQFVRAHNLYTWQTVDGVINIFPKDNYRDLAIADLLKTQIASFKIEQNTSCFRLVDSLLATPEVKKQMAASGIKQSGLNFSGGYFPQLGRTFTLDVSDMTLRSILNKVAKESPLARIWVAKKYGTRQEFFIRLAAFHPDAPPGVKFDIP